MKLRQDMTPTMPDVQHVQAHEQKPLNHNPLDHDSLHCIWCTTEDRIFQALATLTGNFQQYAKKFQEAEGTPQGVPFNFTQTSPVQNQVYDSPKVPYSGVVRSLMIAGNGNVTLTMYDRHNQINGGTEICTLPCNGAAVSIPHRFVVPLEAYFGISTDSSSGTGLVSLSAWIEPVAQNSSEMFLMRGGR